MRRGRPPARVSERRKAERGEWERTVDRVLRRDDWYCRAMGSWPEVACRGRLDPHHLVPRSRGGSDDDANLVTLCRAHHDAVHGWPDLAVERGLLAHSWDESPDYPAEDG